LEPSSKETSSFGAELVSWIKTILMAVVLAFLVGRFLIMNSVVPTGSMIPTVPEQSRIVANRLSYLFDEPARGDIIIFRFPDDESLYFVKRIIALPGETVTIKDGLVYLNDNETPLEEPYLAETPIGSFGPFTVPEGEYFVLGDHRNRSNDARFWNDPYVSEEQIMGKVKLQYYPNFCWYTDQDYTGMNKGE